MRTWILFLVLTACSFVHGEETVAAFKTIDLEIQQRYLKDVKPLLERSCLNCHGNQEHFPWYYSIPGPRQLIDRDRALAKKNIDLSHFPFKGKAPQDELLDAIRDDIESNDMPPFRYRILHSDSKLTEDEKKVIFNWINAAKKIRSEANSVN